MAKILYLLRYYPINGGTESVTIKLANEFISQNHEVGIFYLFDKTMDSLPFIDSKIKIFKSHSIPENFLKTDFNDIAELSRVIFEFNPELIINQTFDAHFVKKVCGEKIKLITCQHNQIFLPAILNDNSTFQKVLFKFLPKKIACKIISLKQQIKRNAKIKSDYIFSDRYVLLSERFENDLRKAIGFSYDKKKVESINNPAFFDKWLSESDYEKKENIVLFVGRISEQKRVDLILQIWREITSTVIRENWHLVVVGNGELYTKMQSFSAKIKCQNVEFIGRCNPLEYYEKAKIFLMTSGYEGWGMTLVEAQMNGCVPIVMDSFASVNDIITNNKNGLLIENNNIKKYSDALKKCIENPAELKKMAMEGIETSKKFNIKNIALKWNVVMKDVLK